MASTSNRPVLRGIATACALLALTLALRCMAASNPNRMPAAAANRPDELQTQPAATPARPPTADNHAEAQPGTPADDEWPGFRRYLTAHYELLTDLPASYAAITSRELERNFALYESRLAGLIALEANPPRRHRMRIFWRLSDFQAYAAAWGETDARNFLFRYHLDPAKREVAGCWKSYLGFAASLRHEGFHQVLREQIAFPPQWLNEGLAEYFENFEWRDDEWRPTWDKGWARQLREQIGPGKRYRSLAPADVLQLSRGAWIAESGTSYPTSWALVWCLMHEWAPGAEWLKRYLAALSATENYEQNTARGWAAIADPLAKPRAPLPENRPAPTDPLAPMAATAPTALGALTAAFDSFVAQLTPTPNYAEFQQCVAAVAARKFDEALAHSDAVLAADQGFYAAWFYRGLALGGLKRYAEALECFLHSNELYPEYYTGLWRAAEMAEFTGDLGLAEELIDGAWRLKTADDVAIAAVQMRIREKMAAVPIPQRAPKLQWRRGWPRLEPGE